MCLYIQGFIESVTHLVKVKSEAHKLKNKVMEADKRIQDSGNEVHPAILSTIKCIDQYVHVFCCLTSGICRMCDDIYVLLFSF